MDSQSTSYAILDLRKNPMRYKSVRAFLSLLGVCTDVRLLQCIMERLLTLHVMLPAKYVIAMLVVLSVANQCAQVWQILHM
jgi:hypothetical protein